MPGEPPDWGKRRSTQWKRPPWKRAGAAEALGTFVEWLNKCSHAAAAVAGYLIDFFIELSRGDADDSGAQSSITSKRGGPSLQGLCRVFAGGDPAKTLQSWSLGGLLGQS